MFHLFLSIAVIVTNPTDACAGMSRAGFFVRSRVDAIQIGD
jgi:hypothetical protein